MVDFNTNIAGSLDSLRSALAGSSIGPATGAGSQGTPKVGGADSKDSSFADAVKGIENYISKIDGLQQSSDASIRDLLSGKNEDITSVVSAVAKADMSFKLLVGVRNKLIEAYKQTMNMPL
ncbi:MAG: flagellar hook-basal body complex protein FliE [Phycisphaerales bacterium]|nr:MAG: flagellar hook-basal body complex protein FliE [Phycisphaerales bacterium]